jgi:mannose-6-phosphate isomerase-like protein (cupin superfamily)
MAHAGECLPSRLWFGYVLDGRLLMDLDGDRSIELGAGQGISVPRAAHRTVILMVEGAGVVPTGS